MASRWLRASAHVLFVVVALLVASSSTLAATVECDRACLKSALDQYLNAIVKHDPTAAPLWVGYRQTENAAVVKPGEGIWKTVTSLGKVQRRYFDAETGGAGYFGTINE